jgi:DNA-binding NarL/FixJ family response regulator
MDVEDAHLGTGVLVQHGGAGAWRKQRSHPPDPSGGWSTGTIGSNRRPRAMNDRATNGNVKVLLADDHTLFRQGLAELLASYGGMEVVGETNNDRGAIELARKKKPDVVIMQVQRPFEKARKSLEELREIWPPPKIVVVTMLEEPRYLREFLHLGIRAYLLKSVSVEELIGAIRAATFDLEGKNVVIGMPREMIERGGEEPDGVLSTREMKVLLLAARGLSRVRTHLPSQKMTVEAMQMALKNVWAQRS